MIIKLLWLLCRDISHGFEKSSCEGWSMPASQEWSFFFYDFSSFWFHWSVTVFSFLMQTQFLIGAAWLPVQKLLLAQKHIEKHQLKNECGIIFTKGIIYFLQVRAEKYVHQHWTLCSVNWVCRGEMLVEDGQCPVFSGKQAKCGYKYMNISPSTASFLVGLPL